MERATQMTWMCPSMISYYDLKGERMIAEVELPGVKKENIKVEAGSEGFCIEARRDRTRFDSCFSFGERTDASRVQAEFRNGLLKIRAPLDRSTLHARRITVQ